MAQPGVIRSLWGILKVLIVIRRPVHGGSETVDHTEFGRILKAVATTDSDLASFSEDLDDYAARMATVDPADLSRDESLAYWINLYNAGALALAAEAQRTKESTVLRVPGAFGRPFVDVAGETLSLDAIEHAKIRRFADPRIHAALVCGAVSCPTLRAEPYEGRDIAAQLEDQMTDFMKNASHLSEEGRLRLSRVFLWYGSDFVRPRRMPTLIPSSKKATVAALGRWLPAPVSEVSGVDFQPYDWGLRCSVGP